MSYNYDLSMSIVNQWDNPMKSINIEEEDKPFSSFEVNKLQVEEDLANLDYLIEENDENERNSDVFNLQPLVEVSKKTVPIFKSRVRKNQPLRQNPTKKDFLEDISILENKIVLNNRKNFFNDKRTNEDDFSEEECFVKRRKLQAPLNTDKYTPRFVRSETKFEATALFSPSSFDLPSTVSFSSSVRPASQSLLTIFKGEDLTNLRFSQRTITNTLGDGTTFLFDNPTGDKKPTLFDILRKEGWRQNLKDRIDVILMPDQKYTSFDNRRLAVAKAINQISHSIEVRAHSHLHSEQAPSRFLDRARDFQFELPEPVGKVEQGTYGHAVTSRILSSNTPSSEQYGFNQYPTVTTGLKGRGVKRIVIDSERQQVVLK